MRAAVREQPFFHAGEEHDGKLQALGVVHRQQRDRRLLVHLHRRRATSAAWSRKSAMRLAALRGFGRGIDQFVQVLQARLRLPASSPSPASAGSRCARTMNLSSFVQRQHRASVSDSSWIRLRNAASAACARVGKLLLVDHAHDRVPQAQIVLAARTASICSTVVLPMPRAGVLMMRSRLTESGGEIASFQIRDDVLDFGALVEAEAADHDILAPVAPQRFFDLPRLEVGPVENRHVLVGIAGAAASRSCRR